MYDFMREITPLLITFNEIDNIERTLAALRWADRVVVVDSGSTDGTLDVLGRYPRVCVLSRRFDTFAAQCQFGLESEEIETEWVLSLDADHVLTRHLVSELGQLRPPDAVTGYEARFTYCVLGRPLRGSLYPPRVVLFRRASARFVQVGHGHKVEVEGRIDRLRGQILHDDRKPLARWLRAQDRYAREEAHYVMRTPWRQLGWADRIRRFVFVAPVLVPFWCLVVKRGLLDGWPGVYYAIARGTAEAILSLRLMEARLRLTNENSGKRSLE